MNTNDLYGFMNTPAFDALRRIQEQFNNSALAIAMKELQQNIGVVKIPTDGITVALQTYHDSIAPLTATVQHINALYTPILEQTRKYENLYNNAMISALQSSTTALKAMAGLDFSAIQSIVNSLSKHDFLSNDITKSINFDTVAELYDEGKITARDIAEEFNEIVSKKEISFVETWDNFKKAKWFLAIRWVLVILMFLGSPVIDKVKDKALDALGVNEFWEESGIYEWLDEVFGIEKDDGTTTEQETKEAVSDENIGNISKKKREDLLDKIKEIRNFIAAAPQDENTGNLLSYLSDLEKDVNGKKYGLVFEEHREEIDKVLDTHTPVLTEDKDLFIDNGGQMNFLIEGDNLASLKLLEKTHKGKIDLIYIDPPYNTGNKDFIYSDIFVDSLDSFKHSKWISFMRNRLQIARQLLSPQGIIFISIDDNEVAQLKLLCDEIFGSSNFRGQIVRGTGTPTGQGNAILSNEFDYVLVYSKTEQAAFNGLPFNNEDAKIYNFEDEYGKYLVRPLRKTGGEDKREDRPRMYYPITAPDGTQIFPIAPSGYESRWRCQESTYRQLMADHRIEWKKDKTGWKVYQKFYLEGRTKQPGNLWIDIEGNKKATITIKSIFGKNVFSFPKPIELIYRVAQIASCKSSYILDFFAGSGTTGHAVMKLNAEDSGNRRFILCTNNENNICSEITYERIKRVIDKEKYIASLKYYKVDYVPISDRLYYEYADELLKHIRELVELENGINFNGNNEIAIVLTEEELDDFISHIDENCKKLYLGHDILMDARQAQILKDRKITMNIIPDYYYKELEG